MSTLDKCGHKVGPDVPTSSNDDDPGQFVLLAPLTLPFYKSHPPAYCGAQPKPTVSGRREEKAAAAAEEEDWSSSSWSSSST